MPINPDAVNNDPTPPSERSWNSKDALIYAVGVGAGSVDPTGFELERSGLRGGLVTRVYHIECGGRQLEAVVRVTPDGLIEQYTVSAE